MGRFLGGEGGGLELCGGLHVGGARSFFFLCEGEG